ncbi:MAG: hypothetical protein NUV61_01595 [Candidatus Azambacteria bacterium]|nr:hypothetical protein [Candidatus Azambacteria bacterium]
MKIELQTIRGGGLRAAAFASRHIHVILFVWVIVVIGLWGFIFWQYGYRVVFHQEETVTRPLIIKGDDLKALLKSEQARGEFQKSIVDKQFPNPFVKFQEL